MAYSWGHYGAVLTRSALGLFLASVALTLAGCGTAAPPPASTIADAAPEPERIDTGPTFYETETGGLNEDAMDSAFNALQRPLQGCLEQGMSRLAPLGGHLKLTMRIQRDGGAKWVYLSESTLGDRETEKCVLDLARGKTWPRPVGGEGVASKTFEFDPREQLDELDAKKARPGITQARTDAAKCRRGVRGKFTATAYLRADGRVLSAGVAPPDEKGEDVADCVVDAILKVRFKKHGGKAAKVSFEI